MEIYGKNGQLFLGGSGQIGDLLHGRPRLGWGLGKEVKGYSFVDLCIIGIFYSACTQLHVDLCIGYILQYLY